MNIFNVFRTLPVLTSLNPVENLDKKRRTAMKKIECVRFFLNETKLMKFQDHSEDEAIGLDEDEGIGTELNSPTDTVDIKKDIDFVYHEEANLEVMVCLKIACSQHVFMFFLLFRLIHWSRKLFLYP